MTKKIETIINKAKAVDDGGLDNIKKVVAEELGDCTTEEWNEVMDTVLYELAKESKEMTQVAKNAEQVLQNVNGMIADIENGFVKNYKIVEVCDELNIFDWWNDNLSKTQLKDMQKFLKEAIKLGHTGYVCFKVGATGCANGMWAYKAESTNGHSPEKGECLYKSFSPAYNYWRFCTEDGKWMPEGDDEYASIKTMAQLEEAIYDVKLAKLVTEWDAENKLGTVSKYGWTKAKYINYLIDHGYNRSDAEWEANRYNWDEDTIDLKNGVTIADGKAYLEDDVNLDKDELVELEGDEDDLYEAQAEIDWQAEQADRLTKAEYIDYLRYNQGFSIVGAEKYANELYSELDNKKAVTDEKQALSRHTEYAVHFVSNDGSEEHITGHFASENEANESAGRKIAFGNKDVYIVAREVTEWTRL